MSDSTSSPTLHLQAPAKINLVLRVHGQRDDGYHELESWMQKVSLYDSLRVEITDSPGIALTCSDPELAVDSNNLAWRAADLYFQASLKASGKGAIVHLEKRIPVSAGLGGGSSDAGTLLRELNKHFDDEFDSERLLDMATSLGADVPFFVHEAPSVLASGIGEKMVAVPPLRDATFILVNPGIGISTAAIFAKFALTRAEKNSTLTGFQKLRSEDLSHARFENDLEEVTIGLFPVIGEIKKALKSLGAETVLMSGSGATVFGIFRGAVHQRVQKTKYAISRLRKEFGGGVFLTE